MSDFRHISPYEHRPAQKATPRPG